MPIEMSYSVTSFLCIMYLHQQLTDVFDNCKLLKSSVLSWVADKNSLSVKELKIRFRPD